MFVRTSSAIRRYYATRQLILAVLLIGAGVICVLLFFTRQITAPRPAIDQSSTERTELIGASSHRVVLPFSEPTTIEIPSIGVHASVMMVGKTKDGTMDAPSGADFDEASWYKYSPTPGQAGLSIIQGHVDYVDKGPGVFFELGNLKKGDTVYIRRKDGMRVTFTIYKVQSYQKSQFPADEIYRATDRPFIALITCSGELDRHTGAYDSNTIAFGAITSVN